MSEDNIRSGGYAASDHRTMLADCMLEITELSHLVKEVRNDISLMQADVDTLNQSLHDFGKQITEVKTKAAEHLTSTAIEAFNEQLKRVEEVFNHLNHDKPKVKRKKWFRFQFLK